MPPANAGKRSGLTYVQRDTCECPKCGSQMLPTKRDDGERVWVCSRSPECALSLPMHVGARVDNVSAFLSHSSADKRFVRRLAKHLVTYGATVWFDETQLRIGDPFPDRIREAILSVDFVVVVVSKNSVSSPWVRKEIDIAASAKKAHAGPLLLPVILDDAPIPTPLDRRTIADFRNPKAFNQQIRRLVETMGFDYSDKGRRDGASVEWTMEGPQVAGYNALLSPAEAAALITRYATSYPRIYAQEKKGAARSRDSAPRARIRAAIKACQDTYKRTVYEEELRDRSTDFARKCNLFFILMERVERAGTYKEVVSAVTRVCTLAPRLPR